MAAMTVGKMAGWSVGKMAGDLDDVWVGTSVGDLVGR